MRSLFPLSKAIWYLRDPAMHAASLIHHILADDAVDVMPNADRQNSRRIGNQAQAEFLINDHHTFHPGSHPSSIRELMIFMIRRFRRDL